MKEKLYSFGMHTDQVEKMLSELISENFLNEERYALAFAGGKFRIKGWGKVKIRLELKKNQVGDYCIRKALASIDADQYQSRLEKLFEEKKRLLKSEKNIFIRKRKIRDFLLQRGYEPDLVMDIINKKTED